MPLGVMIRTVSCTSNWHWYHMPMPLASPTWTMSTLLCFYLLFPLLLPCLQSHSSPTLTSLVTLKLDDNQLERLPANLGRMTALEEVYAAENFLTYLPPSIGWLRRLHTLNVDENDLEELPPEIGSCRHMKILSVHGNKLSG